MIGQKLGSFLIESRIGTGLTGSLYRAIQETNGRVVALKVEAGNDEIALARLRRTGDILEQFRHPNIVRYLASGRYQGTSYLAMEFVAGPSLVDVLAKRGALPWPEVVGLATQLCD